MSTQMSCAGTARRRWPEQRQLESLTGAPIRERRRRGIVVPVNLTLSALLVVMTFVAVPATATASPKVYVRIGDHSWTDQFLVRPKRVHLGSTGGASKLRWRNWGKAIAVGNGRSYSSNSGVAPKDRTGPAMIRFSRRKRCYGRTLYTVVRVKAVGLDYRQNLGCDMGLHIGSKD